jgi:phage shock protein A
MNFATLTEDEFNSFIEDAQKLKDANKELNDRLASTDRDLANATAQLETLQADKLKAEAQSALTARVSGLRSKAEQLLQDQKIDASEFSEYFGKELSEDVSKFGSDEVELKLCERFLAKAESRQAVSPKINFQSLGSGNGGANNSYTSILTAENLAS